jgi:Spy/CpxP family protein refolding chaperone
MSRLSYFGFAALVAGLVLTTSLSAQQGRRGGGFGRGGVVGPLMLLADEAVQKEVGITEDQKAKLATLREEYLKEDEKLRTDAGITGGGGANITDEQRAKLEEGRKKLRETGAPKTKEVLKPEQLERVMQIAYQLAGPGAYTDGRVVKALDLTKEQQEKIATTNKDYQEKMQALFAGGAGGGNREAFVKLRDEQSAELAKVLTKEQADKLTALKGKAFDVSTIQFGGGRGGRPGGKGGDKKKGD